MNSDLLIIGGGPAGYEIAAEAARKGLSVTLIERDKLGGTCLNRGCIPTKCLCASASMMLDIQDAAAYGVTVSAAPTLDFAVVTDRMHSVINQLSQGIDQLLRPVNVVHGEARLAANNTVIVGDNSYTAPRILIATGSAPAMLPIEGADLAVSSDDLLKMQSLPESVCIIGGGVIGMEFASILAAFGVQVTVLEYCREILPPFDADVAKRLRQSLGRRGAKIEVGARVTAISGTPGDLDVSYVGKKGEASVHCAMAVMAVGRRPVVPEGCSDAGIDLTPRGFIAVDSNMQTSCPGIYAVGDVNGLCMLAHAASAQARVALGGKVNLDLIPSAVFTIPECAMVGLTEAQCRDRQLDYATSRAMFAGNGKALAMGHAEGFVKVVYDRSNRQLLGVHVIGPHAADIIAEATAHMAAGVDIDTVAHGVVHAHPTLSEALATACDVVH